MNYDDQLNDYRWKNLRERILQRDRYKCCSCHKDAQEVHHRYYIVGQKAWEYDNDVLVSLCKQCHEEYHLNHINALFIKHNDKLIRCYAQTCPECNGHGYKGQYWYYKYGVCFNCKGVGYLDIFNTCQIDISTPIIESKKWSNAKKQQVSKIFINKPPHFAYAEAIVCFKDKNMRPSSNLWDINTPANDNDIIDIDTIVELYDGKNRFLSGKAIKK